jgi:hypothetical protein
MRMEIEYFITINHLNTKDCRGYRDKNTACVKQLAKWQKFILLICYYFKYKWIKLYNKKTEIGHIVLKNPAICHL